MVKQVVQAHRKSGSGILLGTASMAALIAVIAPVGSAAAQEVAQPPQATTAEPSQTPPSQTPPAEATSAEPAQAAPGDPYEIIVTASRRSEAASKLPFNISAYAGDQLERSNIGNVAELTQQVPNFVITDAGGPSRSGAIPIIRGLNASVPTSQSPRLFESPVGTYLGNSPVLGYLPFIDLAQVEVMRGPQGTLYGAGALSGALRIVPTDPKLGEVSGFVSGGASILAHSDDIGYEFTGALNIPLGETLALRIAGKHQFSAGFIDQNDIMRRTGDDYVAGLPILANPSDVANSSAVYFDKDDVNYSRTTTLRAALLWQPSDAFSVTAAYNYSRLTGNGGNVDNNAYVGGPSPVDPNTIYAPTGDYERSLPILEPYDRTTELASLDASYDLGFATLSSTFTYGHTRGDTLGDFTVGIVGSSLRHYYTGTPANPRTVLPLFTPDSQRLYAEEIRLVSKKGGPIDYIFGVFARQERRTLDSFVLAPGADTQSAAANGGSTVPIILGGTFLNIDPDQTTFGQRISQRFEDYSIYGDVTWHVTDQWQLTGGARFFKQNFRNHQAAHASLFMFDTDVSSSSKVSSQIFKINTSYQFDPSNQVYATWSQGYRRGGSNGFVTSGPQLEPLELLDYVPDKTNNFEIGLKGRVAGIRYAVDVFYIDWTNPQINLNTPFNAWEVVVNGRKAVSKGAELELSGPIGTTGLSFNLGLAYSKARLTEDFSLPAGNAAGGVLPDAIVGLKGDRLPGSPEFSGSFTLNYEQKLGAEKAINYSLGVDFRGDMISSLPSSTANAIQRTTPGYAMFRSSIDFTSGDWGVQLYATNLLNERIVYLRPNLSRNGFNNVGTYTGTEVVARPREIGLRVTRAF